MLPTDLLTHLRTLLVNRKREHLHCDDSFYCCPKCDSLDHAVGGRREAIREGPCKCGADLWNAEAEAAVAMIDVELEKSRGLIIVSRGRLKRPALGEDIAVLLAVRPEALAEEISTVYASVVNEAMYAAALTVEQIVDRGRRQTPGAPLPLSQN